jgi:hypothetical protein
MCYSFSNTAGSFQEKVYKDLSFINFFLSNRKYSSFEGANHVEINTEEGATYRSSV